MVSSKPINIFLMKVLYISLSMLFVCSLTFLPVTGILGQDISEVPKVDLSELNPGDFADDELYIPYYLAHFHRLANSVVTSGDNKGFIDISVWRREKDNKLYNARIMENILSLAFFYSTDRPWNIYYNHPALKKRLEFAMKYWCGMQSEEGYFSEYGPQKWNLAATAFSTKFIGEALQYLKNGPPVDEKIHQQVITTNRKTIRTLLTDKELYEGGLYGMGRFFSNQYSNLFAGGFAFLDIYPDRELETLLKKQVRNSMDDFQSPAGYFYERNGADWNYNLGTHHSNLLMAWHYTRDEDTGRLFVEKTRRWYDWFAYNAALDPARDYYYLNRSIETRKLRPTVKFSREESNGVHPAFEKVVPMARIISQTREGREAEIKVLRKQLESNWPEVDSLRVGEFSAFSPYAFLHRNHFEWYPTNAQKEEAVKGIPYLKDTGYIHQRMDDRLDVHFTFVRKPGYYAAFNTGVQITGQQRYGLGLLWHPELGTFLQSQTASNTGAWGTRVLENEVPYEGLPDKADYLIKPAFKLDDQEFVPAPGKRKLSGDFLQISYPLGNKGHKQIEFQKDRISIRIEHPGDFKEHLPLLADENTNIVVSDRKTTISQNEVTYIVISYPKNTSAGIINAGEQIGGKTVKVLLLEGKGALDYSIMSR